MRRLPFRSCLILHRSFILLIQCANLAISSLRSCTREVPPFVPQPNSTRQVSSTGLSRRCCLRASPDRPTRLRLAVPKWTRRQGEETPLGPSSGEETPISQDGMSYRVRSLPSSRFTLQTGLCPATASLEWKSYAMAQVNTGSSKLSAASSCAP